MINIMNSLADYIDTLGLYAPLKIDTFTEESENMMVRHDPSSAKVETYMDGSRVGLFNFSIHGRSQDADKVVTQLSTLISSLDIRDNIQLTDLIKIKIEPVSSVRFITKTEKLEFIYSSDYVLEYLEKRR